MALSCPGTLLENIGSIRHSRGSIFGLKILSYQPLEPFLTSYFSAIPPKFLCSFVNSTDILKLLGDVKPRCSGLGLDQDDRPTVEGSHPQEL